MLYTNWIIVIDNIKIIMKKSYIFSDSEIDYYSNNRSKILMKLI